MLTFIKQNLKKIIVILVFTLSVQSFQPYVDVVVTQADRIANVISYGLVAITTIICGHDVHQQHSRFIQKLHEEQSNVANNHTSPSQLSPTVQEKTITKDTAPTSSSYAPHLDRIAAQAPKVIRSETSTATATPSSQTTISMPQTPTISKPTTKENDNSICPPRTLPIPVDQEKTSTPANTDQEAKARALTKQWAQDVAPKLALPKEKRAIPVTPAYEYPASSWQYTDIPGGIELRDEETGTWASVTIEEPSPARQYGEMVAEQLRDKTISTLTRMQTDPAYYAHTRAKLDYTMQSFLETNHENIINRLEARLELLEQWGGISFDEPYKTHYQKAINDLILQFFNADGTIAVVLQDNGSPQITRTYFEKIGLKSSSPRYEASELNTAPGRTSKRSTFMRSTPDQEFINRAQLNPANQQLRDFIACCRAFNFDQARNIYLANRKLDAKYHIPDLVFNEIRNYCHAQKQKQYLEQYTKEGIPKICLNDPLVKQLSKYELKRLSRNKVERNKLVELLLAREKILQVMEEAWNITWNISSNCPAVEEALYAMLGTEQTSLSDPKTMLTKALELTSNYDHSDNHEIVKAFFTKQGVFKDFADYPRAQQLRISSEILTPEHHQTRQMLNHLLYIEHVKPNTAQANEAVQALDHIQAYFATTNPQEKELHQQRYTSIYEALTNQTTPTLDPTQTTATAVALAHGLSETSNQETPSIAQHAIPASITEFDTELFNNETDSSQDSFDDIMWNIDTDSPIIPPEDPDEEYKKDDFDTIPKKENVGKLEELEKQADRGLRRGKRSNMRQIEEHREKLDNYKRDPYKYDNDGRLRRAKTAKEKSDIYLGRIDRLKKEILKFKKEIGKINIVLSERGKM